MAQGDPADEILTSMLAASGYLAELQNSTDPQDETRLENLEELVNVAAEFVAAANAVDLDEENESGLAAGMPEPDASLPPSWSGSPWWRTPTRCRTGNRGRAW